MWYDGDAIEVNGNFGGRFDWTPEGHGDCFWFELLYESLAFAKPDLVTKVSVTLSVSK